jgi:hypothetical protein
MYPRDEGGMQSHPSVYEIPHEGEDDGAISVAEFHARWEKLHDAYFRQRDDALRKLLADREALRARLRGARVREQKPPPEDLFKMEDPRYMRLIG